MGTRMPKIRVSRLAIVAICVAIVLALMGAAAAWAVTYSSKNAAWYTDNPSASEFTISTSGELRMFSDLVNGVAVDDEGNLIPAVDFQDKIVCLAGNIALFGADSPLGGEFYPIGSADHPFKGTFDGAGHSISGMEILDEAVSELDNPYSCVGLFGYAGLGSVIKDVTLEDDCRIEFTCADTSQPIEYVGGVVGASDGDVINVVSRASISVVWDDGNAGAARALERTMVISHVGGIVGAIDGALADAQCTGSVYVETPANSTYNVATGSQDAVVASYVGGIAGSAATLERCSNSAEVEVYTTGTGGKDRFGETVAARTYCVAGVAAYATGDVANCANTGNVRSSSYKPTEEDAAIEHETAGTLQQYNIKNADGGGENTGGIVGLHRVADDASAIIQGCSNNGYVLGLNNVGGIVGNAGATTLVTECVNGDASKAGNNRYANVGKVVSTRWNKPCTGGIAGNTYGSVSYCRNHGEVTTTRAGYYIGGIVGNLVQQGKGTDAAAAIPEVFSCYNTGQVDYSSSLRRGAIVGGSSGHVHDCLFLFGTLNRSEDVGIGAIGEDYGTYANIRVAYASTRSARQNSAEDDPIILPTNYATAFLNRTRALQGWDTYWVTNSQANRGYPVIGDDAFSDANVDLPALAPQATLVRDARYTAAYNPTPTLKVTIAIDGEESALVENADYIVVADPTAEGQGVTPDLAKGNRPYLATIRGIGTYKGSPDLHVAYGIEKGDFAECTVSVKSATYTGQAMNDPEVTVYDAGGAEVPQGDYAYTVNDGKDCIDPTTLGNTYRVVCDATATGNYAGHTQGTYTIERIDIARDCDVIGVVWDERVWYYDDELYKLYEVKAVHDSNGKLLYDDETGFPQVEGESFYTDDSGRKLSAATPAATDEAGNPVYGMQVEYTAGEINPEVIGVRWGGGVLPSNWYHVMNGTGDPSELSVTLKNIEASTTGTITVAYNSAYTRNYDVLGFDIIEALLTEAQLQISSDRKTLTYLNGQPVKAPQITLTYNGNTVDPVNYILSIAYARDISGNLRYGRNIPYSIGTDLYYTLSFVNGGSIICDDISDIGPYTVANGQVSLNDDCIVCEFVGGNHDYTFAGVDLPEAIRLINSSTGEVLLEGKDYELLQDGFIFTHQDVMTSINDMPHVYIHGKGEYVGWRHEVFELNAIPISNATFMDKWPYLSTDGRAMIQNCYVQFYASIGKYNIVLPYRSAGYDEDALANVLGIVWRPDDLDDNINSGFQKRGFLAVSAMRDSFGRTVERIKEPGLYEIDVVRGADDCPYFKVASDFAVTRTVEIVPIDLGQFNKCFTFGGDDFQCITYSGVSLRLGYTYGAGRVLVDGKIAPEYEYSYDGAHYAYTGKSVQPRYHLIDTGLLETVFRGKLLGYTAKGNPRYVNLGKSCVLPETDFVAMVSGYTEAGPVESGEYQVTAVCAATESKYATGSRVIQPSELASNRFWIEAADISNPDIVTIIADAAQYTGKPVEPTVHFYVDGEECNYKLGEDYILECANNIDIRSADDADPPTATIRILNKNHLTAHDDNGNIVDHVAIPFDIEFATVDLAAASWMTSEKVALVDGVSDGSLTEASLMGKYQLGDEQHLIPSTAYSVEMGVWDETSFTVKNSGWQVGDLVSYRVIANGSNPAFGGQTIVGPAEVVPATASNSFTRMGQNGCELQAMLDAISYKYAGVQIDPKPKVIDGAKTLEYGVDYELDYGENLNVNTGGTVIVRGIGAYTGNCELGFDITPAQLSDCVIKVDSQVYSGAQIVPKSKSVHVLLGDAELQANDWVFDVDGFGANVDAGPTSGALKIVAGASGNVEGSCEGTFAIAPISLEASRFVVEANDLDYTGKNLQLDASDISVMDAQAGTHLVFGSDFVIQYPGDHTSAGARDIIISGVGNYTGNVSATFNVAPRVLGDGDVRVEPKASTYSGSEICPAVSVEAAGVMLEESFVDLFGDMQGDYKIEYVHNVSAGYGDDGPAVVVTGVNNYAGKVVVPFTISPASMTQQNTRIEIQEGDQVFNGSAREPAIKVLLNGTELPESDYEVAYRNNVDIGTAAIVVNAQGPNFDIAMSEPISTQFSIVPANIGLCKIASIPSQPYAFGKPIEPALTITAPDGSELREGIDYEVEYANNSAIGTATVTAKGIGSWTGMLTASFRVARIGIPVDAVTVEPSSFVYDGSSHAPAVSVVVNGRALEEGVDYLLRFLGDKMSVGSQVIEVYTPSTSVYWSSATVSYEITEPEEPEKPDTPLVVPINMSDVSISVAKSVYTGKPLAPKVVAKIGDMMLEKDADYTVEYSDNVNAGVGKATVTGKGRYIGSKTVSFTIDKAANNAKIVTKVKKAKRKALKKRAVVVKPITVKSAQGKVTYAKLGGSKKLKVNKSTGKVTVKKGTKRGSYKIKVRIRVAGDSNRKTIARNVIVRVKVA